MARLVADTTTANQMFCTIAARRNNNYHQCITYPFYTGSNLWFRQTEFFYTTLTAMFKDGQDIVITDEEIVKPFIFEEVLSIVGATLSSTDTRYRTTTNAEGCFAFLVITEGSHIFTVEKLECNTQSTIANLDTGVVKHKKTLLLS